MENPEDKNLDQLFHKIIKEHGLEQPSLSFTDNVLNEWLYKSKAIEYKPLIGKAGKVLIFMLILIYIILSLLPGTYTSPAYLEFISNFNLLSDLQFSSEFAIVFFTCSVGTWILLAFDKILKNLILK
ncbi:hypothetical protein BH23BAC1_BH23BAC1_12310 [soil metagenome]